SIASRMAGSGATQSLTVRPRSCWISSTSWVLVGSAVATVTVAPSTAIGQAMYWRKYLGDSSLTAGGAEGSSSADRKSICRWTAKARSTSAAGRSSRRTTSSGPTSATPIATRASPRRSRSRDARTRASFRVSALIPSPLLGIWPKRSGLGWVCKLPEVDAFRRALERSAGALGDERLEAARLGVRALHPGPRESLAASRILRMSWTSARIASMCSSKLAVTSHLGGSSTRAALHEKRQALPGDGGG